MDPSQEHRYWNLLAKKLSGEATVEELHELEQLNRSHPELSFSNQHIQDLWRLEPTHDLSHAEEAFQAHWNKVSGVEVKENQVEDDFSGEGRTTRSKNIKWSLAAAVALISLSVLYFTRSNNPEKPLAQSTPREVYSQPGTRTKLLLPDQSVVWLNADSKLEFGNDFGNKLREVQLTGEAYFEVQPSDVPFIVKTGTIHIKVLGTAFNVRSYPSEKTTETSLIHGKVEITVDRRPDEKYILKPNEKLLVNNDTTATQAARKQQPLIVLSHLTHNKDSLIVETSWIDNKLVFENESFEVVALKMSRWYNVEIEFADEQLKEYRFTGVLQKENIYQALEALQFTSNFEFTIVNNKIIFSK